MPRRSLTESEKNSLERSVYRWLAECQRWVDDFDRLLPEKMTDYPSDTDSLIITATYFIMAAGCVYLHCQSLLEAKLGSRKAADNWLKTRRTESPLLQTLLDRRDWLNHGAIYRSPDFQLVFAMVKGPDRTIEEALAELEHKNTVTVYERVRLRWTDGFGEPTDDISYWQREVLSELNIMIEEIKEIG
jgi:hypothetical protein